jgi:hypothetical protein
MTALRWTLHALLWVLREAVIIVAALFALGIIGWLILIALIVGRSD